MKFCPEEQTRIVCTNVKKLRKSLGLSEEEMAEKLNISKNDLSEIEKGILPETVKVNILFRVRDNFNLPLNYLFIP